MEVANPDRLLRPAMSAQVRIVQASVKQVLTVPRGALIDWSGDKDTAVAMVRRPGRPPEARQVRIGLDDGLRVEVREGLDELDRLELFEPAEDEEGAARAAGGERRP